MCKPKIICEKDDVWSKADVWQTGARWFNNIVNVPFSSEPFVAGCVAYFLDNTLHRDPTVRKDRGKHWWDKFQSFKGDTRSEEFYSLPFNLNIYFSSVWYYKALYQILLCWRFKSSLRDNVINHCYLYYLWILLQSTLV